MTHPARHQGIARTKTLIAIARRHLEQLWSSKRATLRDAARELQEDLDRYIEECSRKNAGKCSLSHMQHFREFFRKTVFDEAQPDLTQSALNKISERNAVIAFAESELDVAA